MSKKTVSIYTKGGSEYWLSATGNVMNGTSISAGAILEPRFSGASFSYSHNRTLTVSITDADNNVIKSFTQEITECSKEDSAALVTVANDLAPGLYTCSARWYNPNYVEGSYAPGPTTTVSVVIEIEDQGTLDLYVNNEWKKSTPHVYVNGAWEKTKAYVYHGSQWKEGK